MGDDEVWPQVTGSGNLQAPGGSGPVWTGDDGPTPRAVPIQAAAPALTAPPAPGKSPVEDADDAPAGAPETKADAETPAEDAAPGSPEANIARRTKVASARRRKRWRPGTVDAPGVGTLNFFDECREGRWEVCATVMDLLKKSGTEFDVDSVDEQQFTPLYIAAYAGNLPVVKGLIQAGADANKTCKGGATPLHVAVLVPKNNRVVRALLRAGADPDMPAEDGASAVYVAALRNQARYLDTMLGPEGDGDVNFRKVGGATPLYAAAYNGHVEACKMLMKHGALVDLYKDGGFTPLFAAAECGHAPVVHALLAGGANPNTVDYRGASALFIACCENQVGSLRALADWLDTDVNIDSVKDGVTPLYIAAELGRLHAVRALFASRQPPDVTKATKFGSLPIHIAAENGFTEIANLLLSAGARPDVPISGKRKWVTALWLAAQNNHPHTLRAMLWDLSSTPDGADAINMDELPFEEAPPGASLRVSVRRLDKPLFVASRKGFVDVVEVLLAAGANPDCIREDTRETPIFAAAAKHHTAVVEALVRAGADPDKADKAGSRPIEAAVMAGDADLVDFIVSQKADPHAVRPSDGRAPLHLACEAGHLNVVDLLAKHGVRLNVQDANGATPLVVATLANHVHIVEDLLARGVSATLSDKYGFSALYASCQLGNEESTRLLLQAKGVSDPGHMNQLFIVNNTTPFHAAAMCGALGCLRLLVDAGVNGNIPDANGVSPLMSAARKGSVECVDLVLSAGANVAAITPAEKYTALHLAADAAHVDTVRRLLEAGSPKNLRTFRGGLTPLLMAVLSPAPPDRRQAVIDALLEAGADATTRDSVGVTALYMAAQRKDVDNVKLLLGAPGAIDGIDHMRRDDGTTALFAACQVGAADVVVELLRAGASSTRPNKAGVEPLYIAAQEGHAGVISHLLNYGANPTQCLDDDYPPLFAACLGGHLDAAKVLLEGGADINQATKTGATPYIAACAEGNMAMTIMLIKAGCDPYVRAADDRTGLELAQKMGHRKFVAKVKPLLRTLLFEKAERERLEKEAELERRKDAAMAAAADFEDRRFFKQKELDALKGKNRRRGPDLK